MLYACQNNILTIHFYVGYLFVTAPTSSSPPSSARTAARKRPIAKIISISIELSARWFAESPENATQLLSVALAESHKAIPGFT